MSYTSYQDNAEKKLNKLHIDDIVKAVRSNMPFTKYYNTYVNSKVDLRVNNKCLCPMHDENEPSFRYFTETDTFACFGKCHVAGNVIKFHESYLKHLISTGQMLKYRSISNLNPKEINYYTALQDLVNIMKLKLPPVYLEDNTIKRVTEDALYKYFSDVVPSVDLTKETSPLSILEKNIMTSLILLKDKPEYPSLYKEYLYILTNGYDQVSNRIDLENLYKKMGGNINAC